MTQSQSTEGFIDSLITYLDGVSSLSLTKGVNLFEEAYQHPNQDGVNFDSQIVVFDEGYSEDPTTFFQLLTWSVRFGAKRKGRQKALDALRPLVNFLRGKRIKLVGFTVVNVSVDTSPEFQTEDPDGLVEASTTLNFLVIP